jgi:L-rhamnose mutarotase
MSFSFFIIIFLKKEKEKLFSYFICQIKKQNGRNIYDTKNHKKNKKGKGIKKNIKKKGGM